MFVRCSIIWELRFNHSAIHSVRDRGMERKQREKKRGESKCSGGPFICPEWLFYVYVSTYAYLYFHIIIYKTVIKIYRINNSTYILTSILWSQTTVLSISTPISVLHTVFANVPNLISVSLSHSLHLFVCRRAWFHFYFHYLFLFLTLQMCLIRFFITLSLSLPFSPYCFLFRFLFLCLSLLLTFFSGIVQ